VTFGEKLPLARLLRLSMMRRLGRRGRPVRRVSCRVSVSDRGSEFCGNPERHEYELYLAVEDIDHSRTKTKSPQTNGICERFHKTETHPPTIAGQPVAPDRASSSRHRSCPNQSPDAWKAWHLSID
jgi:transposase InsO family protein